MAEQIGDVLNNREENLPEVGRYNAGQKLLFFTMVVCMLLLLLTGIVIWRRVFSSYFPIDMMRLAALVHALAAFVLICGDHRAHLRGDLGQGLRARDDARHRDATAGRGSIIRTGSGKSSASNVRAIERMLPCLPRCTGRRSHAHRAARAAR